MRTALILTVMVALALGFLPGSVAAAPPVVALPDSSGSVMSATSTASNGTAQPAAAVSQAQALVTLEALFPQVAKLPAPQAQTQTDYLSGHLLWQFSWPVNRPGAFASATFASVDAQTGQLVSAVFPPSGPARTTPLTLAAAQSIAETFLAKAIPSGTADLQAQGPTVSLNGWGVPAQISYSFDWLETVSGVPVFNATVSVQVNALTGAVTNFTHDVLPDVTFPTTSGVLPNDKAVAAAFQSAGLVLAYDAPGANVVPGASSGAPALRPMWELASSNGLWDATTGQALSPDGLPPTASAPGTVPAELTAASPAGQGAPITEAKAQAEADKIAQLAGFAGWTDTGTGAGEQTDAQGSVEQFWSVQFEPPGQSQSQLNSPGISVQISETGGSFDTLFTPSLPPLSAASGAAQVTSAKQATAVATAFLAAVDPTAAGETVAVPTATGLPQAQQTWSVRFVRLYDGIPVATDSIYITVDAAGQVTNYRRDWHDLTPSAGTVQLLDQAIAEQNLAALPVELTYVLNPGPFTAQGGPSQPETPTLAYTFRNAGNILGPVSLDAESGTVYGSDGAPFDAPGGPPKALQGSSAETQLWALDQAGLLPAGAGPNDPVTLGPAIRALLRTLQTQGLAGAVSGTPVPQGLYGTDISNAIADGVLTKSGNTNPDQPVTRQELVAWVVRALGYGALLGMPNQLNVRFADAAAIAPAFVNAVGIAQGLGIVTGDASDRFRPRSPATWAELAMILMRAAGQGTTAP